jgi:hypothetical protein
VAAHEWVASDGEFFSLTFDHGMNVMFPIVAFATAITMGRMDTFDARLGGVVQCLIGRNQIAEMGLATLRRGVDAKEHRYGITVFDIGSIGVPEGRPIAVIGCFQHAADIADLHDCGVPRHSHVVVRLDIGLTPIASEDLIGLHCEVLIADDQQLVFEIGARKFLKTGVIQGCV